MNFENIYIHLMNLARLDLNLLLVFDALFEEGSATRAGERLFLSQPAISNALKRLRGAVGDPLFERSAEGMRPTPRAKALAGPIRQALLQIQSALTPDEFVPMETKRRFNVAIYNYATLLLLAPLAARVRRLAPGVDLRIHTGDAIDIEHQLDIGAIDLAIGDFTTLPGRFVTEKLFEDHHVCLMRAGHPLLKRRFDLKAFAAAPHLLISAIGLDHNWIDEVLRMRGLSRRVAMTAPHFLSAATILEATDLITCVPHRIQQKFGRRSRLSSRALPFRSPPLACMMAWHHHMEHEPSHAWLRCHLSDVARKLDSVGSPKADLSIDAPKRKSTS